LGGDLLKFNGLAARPGPRKTRLRPRFEKKQLASILLAVLILAMTILSAVFRSPLFLPIL